MKPIKWMITGGLLILLGPIMTLVDIMFSGFCLLCWLIGVPVFLAGLFMPAGGFRAQPTNEDVPQVSCPECGKNHDFDYPKCPHCGHK